MEDRQFINTTVRVIQCTADDNRQVNLVQQQLPNCIGKSRSLVILDKNRQCFMNLFFYFFVLSHFFRFIFARATTSSTKNGASFRLDRDHSGRHKIELTLLSWHECYSQGKTPHPVLPG